MQKITWAGYLKCYSRCCRWCCCSLCIYHWSSNTCLISFELVTLISSLSLSSCSEIQCIIPESFSGTNVDHWKLINYMHTTDCNRRINRWITTVYIIQGVNKHVVFLICCLISWNFHINIFSLVIFDNSTPPQYALSWCCRSFAFLQTISTQLLLWHTHTHSHTHARERFNLDRRFIVIY